MKVGKKRSLRLVVTSKKVTKGNYLRRCAERNVTNGKREKGKGGGEGGERTSSKDTFDQQSTAGLKNNQETSPKKPTQPRLSTTAVHNYYTGLYIVLHSPHGGGRNNQRVWR